MMLAAGYLGWEAYRLGRKAGKAVAAGARKVMNGFSRKPPPELPPGS
jgi:hypothetical protein